MVCQTAHWKDHSYFMNPNNPTEYEKQIGVILCAICDHVVRHRLTLAHLFTVTNATEYTRICCDLLEYWSVCSEFEKALIMRHGFVLQTPEGVWVGKDYAHEKFVRLI